MASADWLGKGHGLSRLAGEGSWPQPIGLLADWLRKGQSPITKVAGHGLIRKFERVSGRLLKGRRHGLRFLRFSRKGGMSGT